MNSDYFVENGKPNAYAIIKGSEEYPDIKGIVLFYDISLGAFIHVEVVGLPDYEKGTESTKPIGPFGFHIHEKGVCDPVNTKELFEKAMGHYNPTNQPHGNHAGDLPVLFSNHGLSLMDFYTDRFTPYDVVNRSVVIHQNPDDYRTQPAGDSGKRIACGVIKKFN